MVIPNALRILEVRELHRQFPYNFTHFPYLFQAAVAPLDMNARPTNVSRPLCQQLNVNHSISSALTV